MVAIVAVAAVGTYVPVTLLAPVSAAAVTVTIPDAAVPASAALALPQAEASAVSVMGGDDFATMTGAAEMTAAAGSDEPRPLASISKVITALVILDAKPIAVGEDGPTIVFDEADSDLYDKYYLMDATIQPMDEGSSMSEHDALELMLIVSASNYAEALSTWAYGSQRSFRNAAADWLAANGLTGTTLVEPTGIDPGNVSTATDLITLGKLAMANPVVAEIVQASALDVTGFAALPNTNHLLGLDGINGIKTGTLDEGGACLLFSAQLDVGLGTPLTVIGSVLGGSNHAVVDGQVTALLDSIRAGFNTVALIGDGQEVGAYSTMWGDDAAVVTGEPASVLTWSDTPITSRVETKPVETGSTGTEVGTVTFTAGASSVVVPLVLRGSIEAPDAWWRLTHPVELLAH
ncbi:hypothetical protein GCM10027416_15290 [Okibacterium endophyticum]